jgi:hypothetical protein
MMIPDFLMTDSERRVPLAVPWDDNIKWTKELNVQAETYQVRSLFDVPASGVNDVNLLAPAERIVSPGGGFCYAETRLRRGDMLATAHGRERGTVLFDGPVIIPKLHERDRGGGGWQRNPWMSLTPMEILTLRPGTRRARGSVVIAGLGLGHQLIEVSKRPQVKKLVLVERSRELIDWVLPRIRPHLGRALDDAVVEDVYVALPKMDADVALVDVFPGYGSNAWQVEKLRRTSPRVKFIWGWGTQDLRD